MKGICRLAPPQGQGLNLFRQLKDKYDEDTAWDLVSLCNIEDFMKGKSFRLDSEGFPLVEDLIKDKTALRFIGETAKVSSMEKNFLRMQNTRSNYSQLVQLANLFNNKEENLDYVAIVEADRDSLKVRIKRRTVENELRATDLYATITLNTSLTSILSPIGITYDDIVKAELLAGRVGITDFTKAKNLATSTAAMIRLANNLEGAEALSEEFSHLIIGAYGDEPLIRRALNAIKDEETLKVILGDEYEQVYLFQDGDLDLIAEEALGKLLRENLVSQSGSPERASRILDRLYANLKSKFKNLDETKVQKAIVEANGLMGQLAKNILNRLFEISREKIAKSERAAQFNALSDRILTNIDILKKIKDIEVKRYRISRYKESSEGLEQRRRQQQLIASLANLLTRSEADTRIGIYNYALSAIETMQEVEESLGNNSSFASLRRARSYVLSYALFIQDMYDAIMEAENDDEVPDYLTDIELSDGTVVSMQDIIKDLHDASSRVSRKYFKLALSMLEEFFKPFYGLDIVIKAGKYKGERLSLKTIIAEASSDISFTDMWLDSMASSSDVFLQLFDRVAKSANDKARNNTIDDSRKIERLIKFADENGIKDFEWMFEHYSNGKKNGNYISLLNYAKFEEEKLNFLEYLDEKYGEEATGTLAREKVREYRRWLQDNADSSNTDMPKRIDKYINQDYVNLDAKKKLFFDAFMSIKEEADSMYPSKRVMSNKAILMRKSLGNRVIEAISHPDRLLSIVKESVKQTFMDALDDDTIYGSKTGLTNFDNTEYMALPVLYTTRLKNPEELSTDIFATLMTYKYSANVYNEMSKIVDPLEVARFWATEGRKVIKTRGGEGIRELIEVLGLKVNNWVLDTNTNIEAKIKEFMESAIYQRYMKDEGTLAGINVSKAGNWLLLASSLAQLGFNFLANTANVVTGLAMMNIEAAAGEFFDARELLSADKAYFALLKDFLPELGARVKTNKLSLFDEMFNIKQLYGTNIKNNKKKNWLQKLFGEEIAYLGQDAGDHWLYNRVAIAICKRIMVNVPKEGKATPKVVGLREAEKTLETIIDNSENLELTEDEKFYRDKLSGNLYSRVTSVILAGIEDSYNDTHSDGRPNNWKIPSTNIGTGLDNLVRDFFLNLLYKDDNGNWHHDNQGDEIDKIYPNATKQLISAFLDLLVELKKDFDAKGLTVTARNVVAKGTITVQDGNTTKNLRVAGTLDLLVHDKEGNFYIYDMKTHRGTIYGSKKAKWRAQLSMYKQLLEKEYGITIKGVNIIPIKVTYPTPKGETSAGQEGTAVYTVQQGNLLLCNGTPYKGAKPVLEDVMELLETHLDINYNRLGENLQNATPVTGASYETMSLWDALLVVNAFSDRDDIKKMVIPEGTTREDGSYLDIDLISRQIADVCIDLFGNYNLEDSTAANRVVLGRALLLFRKWIKPLFNRRFLAALPSLITGKTKEGYYRTLARVINELCRGKVQLAALRDELSDEEYSNVKRAITELIQFFSVLLLINFAPWPDDKNRPWAIKFVEYMAKREAHELGMLTPSLTMAREISKTVSSPFAVISTVNRGIALIGSLMDPRDWVDEKKSGPYKGMSTLQANFLRAPILGVSLYRLIERFAGDIDTSLLYYARP